VQPVRVRTAGRGRPALVTGVFLLVASLVLLVSPLPVTPDARSNSPTSRSFADVLVQGDGVAAAVAAAGGRSLAALPIVDGLLARVPADEVGDLSDHPGVRAVTDADRPLKVRAAEQVPGLGWASGAQPLAAMSDAFGGESSPPNAPNIGVAVGVLDTGIAASGDLAGRVVASADLSGEWSFTDSYGHGTFMAGLIAGSGQGGGPAGVAPGADLVDLKVAGADGATTLGQVLAALQLADAARDRFNLRVLNISLGAPADDPATAPLTEAVERLWADGITVVAASGNEGGGTEAPGLDPYVLTVGAVDAAGVVPAWSSRGTDFAGRAKPDLVAPGVGLVGLRAPGSTIDLANPSARVGERYFRGSGTSMSTAVVAGAAAVVAAAHPDWGPDRVKAALTGTAAPLGQPAGVRGNAGVVPRTDGAGAGALDLPAAVGVGTVAPANADLFPLRTVGRAGGPRDPEAVDGLDWRAGGGGPDGLRWAPAGGLPGPTPGADDTDAWTAHPWLSGGWTAASWASKSWAAQQWLARAWAARRWAATGLVPAGWAALQWSWGGLRAAALDGIGLGGPVDWLARSWAARSWAQRAWSSDDLAARSWAARSWAELAWEARSWAARSWAAIDWTARSWASRRWTAGAWALMPES
jgi:serine protease AprX